MPWFKEPLLHFLLIGVALFALYYQVADPQSDRPRRIEVSAADIERMANLWARRWQRPPTPAELQGLIKAHVREEVLYREARALGLEQNDTIVRRRMAQKMEFFFQDIAARKEPSDDELQDFMENNAERFRRPARLSLTQVYLSRDKRGGQVMQDAEMLLEDLRLQGASADPGPVSDTFMFGYRFDDHDERDISRMLGEQFADAVAALPVGSWQGPVESGYGVHLVFVHDRVDAALPPLAEIRERVRNELLSQHQRKASEAVYQRLRERYDVVIDKPEGEGVADAKSD
jgi:hypothetical protein